VIQKPLHSFYSEYQYSVFFNLSYELSQKVLVIPAPHQMRGKLQRESGKKFKEKIFQKPL